MENLWKENSPQKFWQTYPQIEPEIWQQAAKESFAALGLPQDFSELEQIYAYVLGEKSFGENRYDLSTIKRAYYQLKPVLPRFMINVLKKINSSLAADQSTLSWPVEDRFVKFQWEILGNALNISRKSSIQFQHFWPKGKNFAFVLTHDVETGTGQAFIRAVADLEEELGFRSSFNFVPEKYPLDFNLMEELKVRGFEVGVHGLRHDGKLFFSKDQFLKRAEKINTYLQDFGAVGFRAPLTHRNPEWMQSLKLEYDLSFFDTDPYEPVPGGAMSIWPYTLGNFIELPYTLVQDSTLLYTLEQKDPGLWLDKLEFLEKYYGMALLNSHPDYLKDKNLFNIYRDFLINVKNKGGYWHALPKEVAAWWKKRAASSSIENDKMARLGTIHIQKDGLLIT